MLRRYVLTGAPGSGKTSVLNALADCDWPVVHEAATDVITLEQARGCDEPWLRRDFTSKIVAVQRERQLKEVRAEVQFYDRSPLCTLALTRFLGHAVTSAVRHEVERVVRDGVYETDVFVVRPLGFIERTAARRISYREALAFEAIHEDVYRDLGFTLVDVPSASISARTAAVEAHVLRLTRSGRPAGQEG